MQNKGEISFTNEQFFALIETNRKLTFKIEQLEQTLAQFKKLLFGAKHERVELINANQLPLGLNLGEQSPIETKIEEISFTRKKTKEKANPNRSPLPANLPREIIEINPLEDITGMKLIGYDITEQLEMTPAKFYVKQYRRAKYARTEGNGIAIGSLPDFALPKAIAGSSVLAHLLVSKYVDHLPLHRQIKMFSRIGMTLSDSTVNDWVVRGVNLLRVIHDRQSEILLSSNYIQIDETPIQVLESEKKGKTHRGYFWVSHSPQEKVVVFNYSKGRSAQFPTEFLKKYHGYLQTDGYVVYNSFEQKNGITLLGCMAHARREFMEASNNDKQRSDYFIGHLQRLYKLEEELRQINAGADEILAKRQEIAVPILEHLHQWLKENIIQVTPQSSMGKAIAYAITRWDKLMRYAHNPILQIDNNLIENQIRPVAIGRKNYMFCGSHESAERTAIIYSLFGTCKLHNINPHDWLLDVLQKLPARKANNIDDLLPQNWKPDFQGVV